MARLAGFLLPLLSAASLLGATEKNESLQVKQDPPQIQAWPGGSVELPCQIVTAMSWERLRVEWRRDDSETLCSVLLYNGSASNCCRGLGGCDSRFGFTWHPPTFTLRMGNASASDEGRYVCRVMLEIPDNMKAEGNGTMLNISAAGEGGGGLRSLIGDPVFWLGLAGALAVVGLLPAVICCYKHRCKNPGQEIYVNVLYRQKQAEKKAGAEAQSKTKQSSIYTLEFQGGGHSHKLPVAGRSPIPTKASKQASSFKPRATTRP